MATRYFTPIGTTTQLMEFQRVVNTFKLKSKVLSKTIIRPNLLESIEIEVEGEQEEITKLMCHFNNFKF
jgi:hypothetical protein|tara:strand:+ start:49 stop:255 length:207 start_codon:yes stop_codon:yes gene_type:complete